MARILFAILAFVLLALSGYVLYQEFNPEWKGYQKEYYRILASLAADEYSAEQIRKTVPKIEQVYNTDYGITDRCITCHRSYADPGFADEEQPFRAHPRKIVSTHPIDQIGCAVCHDGNSYATTTEAAHGFEKHSMRPLLTGVWVQSRCTRCHAYSNVPGVAVFNRGLELIDRAACFACHEIKQLPERERIAPNLDGIGSKVHPEWLMAWLKDPQTYLKDAMMPGYGLDDRQALSITAYMMTLDGDIETTDRKSIRAGRSSYSLGEVLFEKSACQDCHSDRATGGFEGIWAPDLSRIGDKVNRDWLVGWLQDPIHFQPATVMPNYGFSSRQANALADYLIGSAESEADKSDSTLSHEGFETELENEELIAAGKSLFDDLGCLNCHALDGRRSPTKIGPDLSDAGDWGAHHLEWGQVEHEPGMGLREFIGIKLEKPREFGGNTRMPTFNLSAEDRIAITVALMSFSESPLEMQTRLAEPSAIVQLAMPAGKTGKVFRHYKCLTCHSLHGQYGHMAPELSFEGDKVKSAWLAEYLRTPHLIRPLDEKRMPWLGMSEEEIRLVTEYIDIAWKDDRVPEDPFHGRRPSRSLINKGRELYGTQYECAGCHSINGEGDEVGPALDGVGKRLKPGWIYQWLLDPQLFYENDMPDEDVTKDDARAMTAFLMSLR